MEVPFKIIMQLGIFQLIMYARYFGNICIKLTSTGITNTLFVSILFFFFQDDIFDPLRLNTADSYL